MTQKKKIQPDGLIELQLCIEEHDLTLDNTFLDSELESLLESAEPEDDRIRIHLTLDDLDDLLGTIAATSNHAQDKHLEASLDRIYDRLTYLESTYEIVDD